MMILASPDDEGGAARNLIARDLISGGQLNCQGSHKRDEKETIEGDDNLDWCGSVPRFGRKPAGVVSGGGEAL